MPRIPMPLQKPRMSPLPFTHSARVSAELLACESEVRAHARFPGAARSGRTSAEEVFSFQHQRKKCRVSSDQWERRGGIVGTGRARPRRGALRCARAHETTKRCAKRFALDNACSWADRNAERAIASLPTSRSAYRIAEGNPPLLGRPLVAIRLRPGFGGQDGVRCGRSAE